MTRKGIFITIAAIVILAGIAWYSFHKASSSQPAADHSSQAASEPVALVKTQPLQKRILPTQLTAYGEVTTGKVEGVSFPRAGQVSQLLVTQGQQVKRGTPLATLASDPSAQLAYNQAVNAVHYAQGELKRQQELFALQLATQSQVDNARKALRDAEATLAAQEKLGGNVASATVRAPFDGVVTALSVAQGDRLQPGATILQLGHTDSLRVQLGIEPDDSRRIRAGMPVTLAPVQNDQQRLEATITQMHDLIDPKTQMVNALIVLPVQSARFLVPGMRVKATINAGQQEAWAVPRQAVLTDDKGAYIYQVDAGKAHRVDVRQGQESGEEQNGQGFVAISGPVNPALPVVVLGNYELQDGMRVREGAK